MGPHTAPWVPFPSASLPFQGCAARNCLAPRATVQAPERLAPARRFADQTRWNPSPGGRTQLAHPFGDAPKDRERGPLTAGVCALSSSLVNHAKPVPSPRRRGHQTEARTLTYCIPGGCEPRPACDGAGSLMGFWRQMMRRFNMGPQRARQNVVSLVTKVTYSGCSRSTHFGSGVH